jgi:hypothetical protein
MPLIFKNKKIIILFSVVLFLIISSFCFWNLNKGDESVSATGESWYSSSWTYRKPIIITNNGIVGVVNGNPVLGSVGKFGTAINFDGTGDYILYPDSNDWDFGSSNFTIDAWVNKSDSENSIICSRITSSDSYFYFGWEGSNLRLRDYNVGTTIIDNSWSVSVSTGTWYHVAVVRSGNNFDLYLNGVKQGSTYVDSDAFMDRAIGLQIGAATVNGTYYINGLIDEFRISKGTARWTADFSSSLPSLAYTPDSYTKLLLHLDETVGLTSVYSDDLVENYQTKITVPYVSTMNSDFSDLRFTSSDGVTLLDYWIESYTASTSAVVWVEVASLVKSTTVYMYYGNTSATTTSSGDSVFLVFDDFNDGTIDSSKWTQQLGTWTETGGYITASGSDYHKFLRYNSQLSVSNNYIAELMVRGSDADLYTLDGGIVLKSSNPLLYNVGYNIVINNDINAMTPYIRIDDTAAPGNYNSAVSTWYWVKVVIDSTNKALVYVYDQTKTTLLGYNYPTTVTTSTTDYFGLKNSELGNPRMDDFRIRKYLATEPTIVIGEESASITFTSVSISTADSNICKTVSSEIVCNSGKVITFNSVATFASAIKLYICKDSSCTNCGISSQTNCWTYSSVGSTSNPAATYTPSSCENAINSYWSKVCSSTICSDIK